MSKKIKSQQEEQMDVLNQVDITNLSHEDFVKLVVKEVNKKFHQADQLAEVIATAYLTNTNVILYGPGGYGKSDIVSYIFNVILNIKANIFACSESTSVDELFGGLNMQKFMKGDPVTGETSYEYKYENSVFIGAKIAILEEAFDMPDTTAMALKLLMTSRKIYQNNVGIPIDSELIIVATNVSPEEYNSRNSDSLSALIQRFPIQYYVRWKTHKLEDYIKALELSKDRYPNLTQSQIMKIAQICSEWKVKGQPCAPRYMHQIANMINELGDFGFASLSFTLGIPANLLNQGSTKSISEIVKEEELIKVFEEYFNEHSKLLNQQVTDLLKNKTRLEELQNKLKSQLINHEEQSYKDLQEIVYLMANLKSSQATVRQLLNNLNNNKPVVPETKSNEFNIYIKEIEALLKDIDKYQINEFITSYVGNLMNSAIILASFNSFENLQANLL